MLTRVTGALFQGDAGEKVQLFVVQQGNLGPEQATFAYNNTALQTRSVLGHPGCEVTLQAGIRQFETLVVFNPASPAAARYDLFQVNSAGGPAAMGENVTRAALTPAIGFGIDGAPVAAVVGAGSPGAPRRQRTAAKRVAAARRRKRAAPSRQSGAKTPSRAPASRRSVAAVRKPTAAAKTRKTASAEPPAARKSTATRRQRSTGGSSKKQGALKTATARPKRPLKRPVAATSRKRR
jgi:hypothetical protein